MVATIVVDQEDHVSTSLDRAKALVARQEVASTSTSATETLRRAGRVTIADLLDAEARLADAIEADRRYADDADQWSGHETVDNHGRRSLVFNESHFDQIEQGRNKVAGAEAQLRGAWTAYFGQLGLQLHLGGGR